MLTDDSLEMTNNTNNQSIFEDDTKNQFVNKLNNEENNQLINGEKYQDKMSKNSIKDDPMIADSYNIANLKFRIPLTTQSKEEPAFSLIVFKD